MTAFHFTTRSTPLHRMDVRAKLVCLAALAGASAGASPTAMAVMTAFVLAGAVAARLPLSRIVRELRLFWLFLFFVVLSHGMFTRGGLIAAIPGTDVALSREGLVAGGLLAWRLLMIVLAGNVLSATTPPADVGAAVAWFLRPVPLVPAGRIAVMMSLMMRFLPVILDETQECVQAQRARLGDRSRNPVKRARKIAPALLFRTFSRADQLAVAMDSRCYSESRTPRALAARPADIVACVAVVACCLALRLI